MKDGIGFILPLGRQILNLPFTYTEKRDLARRRATAREERDRLEAAGYRMHETDWEIHRGGRRGERIVDVVISHDGMYVWTKLGPANESGPELQTDLQTGPGDARYRKSDNGTGSTTYGRSG